MRPRVLNVRDIFIVGTIISGKISLSDFASFVLIDFVSFMGLGRINEYRFC